MPVKIIPEISQIAPAHAFIIKQIIEASTVTPIPKKAVNFASLLIIFQ